MQQLGRTLILMLVALLALAALGATAFAPSKSAIPGNDEVVRRDDSYDVYSVSDDDDDGPGGTPTNDTGSDANTNGNASYGTLSDRSTEW